MKDLIDRLSKLDGPDREMDIEIQKTFFPEDTVFGIIHLLYTGSIDASVALAGKLLPGWQWGLHPHGGLTRAYVGEISPLRPMPVFADHALPAIALCIAILRAKEASKL